MTDHSRFKLSEIDYQIDQLERMHARWSGELGAEGSGMTKRDVTFLEGQIRKLVNIKMRAFSLLADVQQAISDHKADW